MTRLAPVLRSVHGQYVSSHLGLRSISAYIAYAAADFVIVAAGTEAGGVTSKCNWEEIYSLLGNALR